MATLRRIDIIVPALAFLTILVLPLPGWGQERVGTVMAVEGTAEVQGQGGTWEQLKFRDAIFLGDMVRTAAASTVKVLLRDDSIMTLAEKSQMQFNEVAPKDEPGRTVVDLAVGTIRALTSRFFGPGSATEVHTPNTVAGVRGTIFLVTFILPDTTVVVSFDGVVLVRHLDPAIPQREQVRPGQRSIVVGSAPPTPATNVSSGELNQLNQAVDQRAQVPSQVLPTSHQPTGEVPRGETEPSAAAQAPPIAPAAALAPPPSLPQAQVTDMQQPLLNTMQMMVQNPPHTSDTSPAGMEFLTNQNNPPSQNDTQLDLIITIPRQ